MIRCYYKKLNVPNGKLSDKGKGRCRKTEPDMTPWREKNERLQKADKSCER